MLNTIFQNKKPFIGFITAGDGGKDYSVQCCLQMVAGGVDIIELGMPFSDPVADGVAIQKSSQRALSHGTTLDTLLEMAKDIRQHSRVPLVLFSYFNPLLQKGEAFLQEVKAAGFNAVLIVDLPGFTETGTDTYFQAIRAAGLSPIFLVSPSTSNERLQKIAAYAEGFIYFACRKGTTGVATDLPSDLSFHMNRFRNATQLPIVIGFGIADNQNAEKVLNHADGFVVGSAFVNLMERKANPCELKNLAKEICPANQDVL